VLRPDRRVTTAAVEGRDQRAALVPARRVRRVIRRGERLVTRVSGVPAELEGPLPAGARVGMVEVRWRGRTVDRVPLVTALAVPKPSVVHEAGKVVGRTLLLLAVAAAALGSLRLVVVIRRRQRRRRAGARRGGVA
jgi:D-alanyl-D-alanine carboxypeptidase (penicillin-binding protein 5/6)